jgi:hypothetical protein
VISGLFYNTAASAIALETVFLAGERVTYLSFLGGKIPITVQPGVPYTLKFLFGGAGFGVAYVNGVEVGRGLKAGVGFPSTLSNCWLGDLNGSAAFKVARTYDDFAVWVPDVDPMIFANRTARLTDEGIFRSDAAGLAFGPVAYPGTDLPRIPVSGVEERPVEVALRPSTGDFGDISDSLSSGNVAFQLSYKPCWSEIPV